MAIIEKLKEKYILTILWICFIFYMLMIIYIFYRFNVFECLTCFLHGYICGINLAFDFFMSILTVLGGGLISVIGILSNMGANNSRVRANREIQLRKNNELRLSEILRKNEEILTFLKNSAKIEKTIDTPASVIANAPVFVKSKIFIDAMVEDSEFTKSVQEYLSKESISYLSPFGFKDSQIHVEELLHENIKYCEIIFILCGKKQFSLWLKNRIRLYEKLRLQKESSPFPSLFVLYVGNDYKIDEKNSNIRYIHCTTEAKNINECRKFMSIVNKLKDKEVVNNIYWD